MNHQYTTILYLFSLLTWLISSFLFPETRGLVIMDSGELPFYVTDLKSSGSDDNIIFELGGIFAVLLLGLRIFRFKNRLNLFESICALIALTLMGVAIIFMIEVGSISATLRYTKNYCLVAWLFSYVGLIFLTVLAVLRRIIPISH